MSKNEISKVVYAITCMRLSAPDSFRWMARQEQMNLGFEQLSLAVGWMDSVKWPNGLYDGPRNWRGLGTGLLVDTISDIGHELA